MTCKKLLQTITMLLVMILSFSMPGNSLAWGACNSTVTVQWGDSLSGIAAQCGTTVDALRAANPNLGWWLYPGQVLFIPTGYTYSPTYYQTYSGYSGTTYTVQAGDTLGIIAAIKGISVADILSVNPQIWDVNLIYVGQVINLPANAYAVTPVYVAQPAYIPPPAYPNKPVHPSHSYSPTLKISYKLGLYVRCNPGGEIIGWATYDGFKKWQYYPNSIFRDEKGKVWVQVVLDPPQSGYTTGWILVKDQYGNYFTDPSLE